MAISGLVLVLFVLGHMLGNLQMFLGPEAINVYAHKLQSMPPPVLWGGRLFLLAALVIHVWMAVLLTIENRQARPQRYHNQKLKTTTYSARVMPVTGLVLLLFIIFHILHYTVRVSPELQDLYWSWNGVPIYDVYGMMIKGFKNGWVSLFYILATGLLCSHLSHGASSMFQSFGLRNEKWRYCLNRAALVYGWVIFLGFASVPVAVLSGYFDQDVEQQVQLQLLPSESTQQAG